MRKDEREKRGRPALLRLLQGETRPHPTAADWDERRERRQGASERHVGPVDLLADISWLSMVCFVEAIDPGTLGLSEHLAAKVRSDLEALQGHDTLEMYWSCLDRLRRLGIPAGQGEDDVADSE